MKIGHKAVSQAIRIESIYNTVKRRQVISVKDLAMILDLAESYLHRLLRFYCVDLKKTKVKSFSDRHIVIYYLDDLSEEKVKLIAKRYGK